MHARAPLTRSTAVVCLAMAAGNAFAQQTFVLTPLNNIQATVNAAEDGDTIVLSALESGGTVFGEYTQAVEIFGKRLTIEADPQYAGQITVSAAGLGRRVFFVGETPESDGVRTTLRGLRFADGLGATGGGLGVRDTDLFVEDCLFENNVATDDGGGVFIDDNCAVTFLNCAFRNNEALGEGSVAAGGAIRTDNGSVVVVDRCRFESNLASAADGRGAAIYTEGTTLTVRDSEFRGHTGRFGGAISGFDSSDYVITDSIFEDNTATNNGGAVRNVDGGGETTLERCVFRGNHAAGVAGAVEQGFNGASGPLIARDCTFENNTAGSNGGAIYSRADSTVTTSFFYANSAERGGGVYQTDGNLDAANCVFVGNHADAFGGALYDGNQGFMIDSCTFVANTAGNQPVAGGGDNGPDTLHNCIINGNLPAATPIPSSGIGAEFCMTDLPGDAVLGANHPGSFDGDAAFLRAHSPGPDGQYIDDPDTAIDETADNDYGDLRLAASSPGIDAGNTPRYDFVRFGGFDLAGNNRATDEPMTPNEGIEAIGFVNIDVGAYEFQPQLVEAGPGCNVADQAAPFGRLDIADVVAFLNVFGGGCPE